MVFYDIDPQEVLEIGFSNRAERVVISDWKPDLKKFLPDPENERSPIFEETEAKQMGFREVNLLDLRTLCHGTIIFFRCGNPYAFYIFRSYAVSF